MTYQPFWICLTAPLFTAALIPGKMVGAADASAAG